MLRKAGISFLQVVTLYLVFALLIISSIPSRSEAMFITPERGSIVLETPENIVKVQTFLENKIVQQRLADFGLTQEEVSSRVNEMSPDQLHLIATHIDRLDYGGDSALGVVVTILVIIILIMVILKLMGRQVIIK